MNHNPKPKTPNSLNWPNLKSKWLDITLLLILSLLPLLFFWRLITPIPADQMHITSGDFTEQYFPLRAFAAQEWVRGQIPLWNPYLYGGQPALADIQSGALYPLHVLEALMLGWGAPLFGREVGFPIKALEWQVIIHFSLAAVGTYLFVRHLTQRTGLSLRRTRFGAVIASLVFTYSGYLTGFPVQQLTILEVSAWLPWILWGLDTALWQTNISISNDPSRITHYALHFISPLTHSLKTIALSALAFAMPILAGHPQTVLYIFYLTLAYTLFHSWRSNNRPIQNPKSVLSGTQRVQTEVSKIQNRLPLLVTNTTVWLTTIFLGTSIAAAQLLPTLEFITHSVRADLSYQAVSNGLPLNELVSILYPGFFGGSPQYVGIATLILIALALTLTRPQFATTNKQPSNPKPVLSEVEVSKIQNLKSKISFWAGVGLISLLLSFGSNTFLYPLFYLLAPGFDAVRQQERAFLIYSFSAAILAGYGAIILTGPLSKISRSTYALFERYLRIVGLVAVGLTAFYIYGSTVATARGDEVNLFFGVLQHHLFGLLILGGMILLLALRPRRWLRRPWGMTLLAVWLTFNLFTVNWRFNLEKPPNSPSFTPNGIIQFLQSNPKSKIQNPKSLARIVSGGLFPNGNSAASVYNLQDLTGNTPLQLATVNAFLNQMPSWRLWQLMNVRYIIAKRDISDPGLSLVFTEGDLNVFEMGDPFERVWFVANTEVIANYNQALTRLASDNFDLRRTAIVAEPLTTLLNEMSEATATVVDFSPTRLAVAVDTPTQQLMVASQIYYPGWHVEIDGQPADLLQVNVVQQGVVVPAGKHTVRFTYWSATFVWGLAISGIGLLVCGVMLLVKKRS